MKTEAERKAFERKMVRLAAWIGMVLGPFFMVIYGMVTGDIWFFTGRYSGEVGRDPWTSVDETPYRFWFVVFVYIVVGTFFAFLLLRSRTMGPGNNE